MPYQSIWNHKRDIFEQVLEEQRAAHPHAWQAAHNPQRGDKRQREEYCQRVCARLREFGIPAGMNGKRGNPNDLSEDIIALPRTDRDGAPDTSGRFPSIEIRDVIASAGPDRDGNQGGRPYFGDVTQATLDKGEGGCYVEPTPQNGGVRPPIGGEQPDPPIVLPGPIPGTDYQALADRVRALEESFALILSGIGALATQVGNLEGKLLNADGAFDRMTKRIFGVGMDDASVAQEVILLLQNLEPEERTGALEGCRVVPYLRQRS